MALVGLIGVFCFIVIFILFKFFNPIVVLFFGIIVLLCILALKSSSHGVLAIMLVLPFIDFFKRALFIFDVNATEYFLVKSLPDLIPILMLVHLFGSREHRVIRTKLDQFVLFYIIWVFAEAFNPGVPLIVGMGGIHLYIMPLLVYFYAKDLALHSDNIQKVFYIILGTAVITVLYGYYHAFFGMTSFEQKWVTSEMVGPNKEHMITIRGYLRAFSTFTSHKEFGFSLAVTAIVLLYSPVKLNSLVRALSVVMISVALAYTFHRASLVVLLVGIVTYYFYRERRSLMTRLISIGVLISPLFVWAIGSILSQFRFRSGNLFIAALLNTGTFEARTSGIESALRNPGEWFNPFGHGIGSIFIGRRIANITSGIRVPHNGYLEMLWEIGLFGTVIFVVVVILIFMLYQRMSQIDLSEADRRTVNLSAGIITGILLTHGMINSFTQMYHTAVYFWLFLGMTTGIADRYTLHQYKAPDNDNKLNPD